MTDIEQWKLEREALDRRIAQAETVQLNDRARETFRALGTDTNLPMMDILDQALALNLTDPNRTKYFIERLTVLVQAHGHGPGDRASLPPQS